MQTYLILLDGAKGAGKSTVSNLLRDKLPGMVILDWGSMWRLISDQKPRDEDDAMVLEAAVQHVRSLLNSHTSALLDNHLTEKRMQSFDLLGKECGAQVLKYHLVAPPEILLSRVRQRDTERGQETNEERFHRMHQMQQSKDFSDFKTFNTTRMSPEAIADSIIKDLSHNPQA